MGLKCNVFLVTIEFLLVVYILLDIYASVFIGLNDMVSPEDMSMVGSNATDEDPKVVGLGKFAVEEYNMLSKSNLKFQNVVKAMYAKSSYMLLIQVGDGDISQSKEYGAIVYMQGDRMSLVAFEEYLESGI